MGLLFEKGGLRYLPGEDGVHWECHTKHIERNYFWKEIRADIDELETPLYQRALRKRQIWSEGTFAAQKWGNNLACFSGEE